MVVLRMINVGCSCPITIDPGIEAFGSKPGPFRRVQTVDHIDHK